VVVSLPRKPQQQSFLGKAVPDGIDTLMRYNALRHRCEISVALWWQGTVGMACWVAGAFILLYGTAAGESVAQPIILPSGIRQATCLVPNFNAPSSVYLPNGSTPSSPWWTIAMDEGQSVFGDCDFTYVCEDPAILDGEFDCRCGN
jgi:hypothetical protein